MGRMINDPTLYNDLTAMTSQLKSAAQKINSGQGSLGRLIADSTLYVDAARAASGIDTLVTRINGGEGSVGKALNDDAAYDEMQKTIVDLRKLLESMQSDPRKFFKFSVF